MKKFILFILSSFFISNFICAENSLQQNAYDEISLTRKYDSVLKIDKSMEGIFNYLGKEYIHELPVAAYGFITETEALEGYKKLAEENNTEALYALGCYYRNHIYIKNHYKIALDYFSKLTEMNYIPGIHSLGYLYDSGYENERNVQKAIECYEKCAENNYAKSLLNLAYIYLEDNEVEQDLQKALAYAEKGLTAENSNSIRQQVASILIQYFPAEENINRAEKLLLENVEEGYGDSYRVLADLYKANGARPDDKKEAFYFRKQLEYTSQLNRLFRETERELLPYLLEQEKNGDKLCLNEIIFIYNTSNAICPDFKNYYEYALKSAEAGNVYGMYVLAAAYDKGEYFNEDKAKSAYWYKKAYEENPEFTMCLYELTRIYVKSIFGLYEFLNANGDKYYSSRGYWEDFSGIKEEEVFSFFKALADETEFSRKETSEHKTAKLAVAFFYENGIGTEKNHELAEQYGYKEIIYEQKTFEEFSKKAEEYVLKDEAQISALLEREENGTASADDYYEIGDYYNKFPNWENIQKAYKYFEKAADMGDSEALWTLGNWYEQGIYVHYDFKKFLAYYILSASLGKVNIYDEIAHAYEVGNPVDQNIDEAIGWYLRINPKDLYGDDLFRLLLDDQIPERYKQKKSRNWWDEDFLY